MGAFLPAAGSTLGTVLAARYELRARIGAGGMGEVFEAVDRRLDRTVAVKVLRAELAGDRRFPARLRREARTVAGLAHPGIVSVHDFGEDAGHVFIVMELVGGSTLSELLHVHGPMSPAQTARIGMATAQALAHAHARGVVHRDVSPTNVMITPRGEVKVLDFGIARAARGSSLTGSGSARGTVAYVAPERLSGAAADHRADVYSLGMVLIELATGSPDPARLEETTVPSRFAAALRRCVHPDPDRRFDDAATVAEELWKVAMVAPEVPVAPESAPTVPLRREVTERLVPRIEARSPRRWRPSRIVAAIALAVTGIAAALVAGPTLASMGDRVTPEVRAPKPLPVPTALAAAAGCDGFMSTGVSLSWTPGAGGHDVTGYQVWRRGGGERGRTLVARIEGAGVTTYRDADLGVDTAYAYTVRAVNGVRVSRPSKPAAVATPLLCLT